MDLNEWKMNKENVQKIWTGFCEAAFYYGATVMPFTMTGGEC